MKQLLHVVIQLDRRFIILKSSCIFAFKCVCRLLVLFEGWGELLQHPYCAFINLLYVFVLYVSARSLGGLFQRLLPQDKLQRKTVQWLLVDVLIRV